MKRDKTSKASVSEFAERLTGSDRLSVADEMDFQGQLVESTDFAEERGQAFAAQLRGSRPRAKKLSKVCLDGEVCACFGRCK